MGEQLASLSVVVGLQCMLSARVVVSHRDTGAGMLWGMAGKQSCLGVVPPSVGISCIRLGW